MGFSFGDVVEVGARGALAVSTFGASEALNYAMGDPLGGISDFADDPTGAKKAAKQYADALRKAGRIEEAMYYENLAFSKEIYAEQKPFRDAALRAIPFMEAELARDYKSPTFEKDVARGMASLQGALSAYGVQGGTVLGTASGELVSGLKAAEMQLSDERKRAILSFLLGGRTSGAGEALSGRGLTMQAGSNYAQTIANIGAIQAQGSQANAQFWSNLFGQVAGAAVGGAIAGPSGAVAGGATGRAASTPGTGNYNLQAGTGYSYP